MCWGNDYYGQASPPARAFSSISAGPYYSCGITLDGELLCWGTNFSDDEPPSGSYTSVSVGDDHACALATSGAIACWGWDDWGQSSAPSGTFRSVSAGEWHSCGVTTAGEIECWGWNDNGECDAPACRRPDRRPYPSRETPSLEKVMGFAVFVRVLLYNHDLESPCV